MVMAARRRSSDGVSKLGSDPWSDLTWGDGALNDTFETDIFDFEANKSTFGQQPQDFESVSFLFPNDPLWASNNNNNNDVTTAAGATTDAAIEDKKEDSVVTPIVHVAIHEQLSALYDDVSAEPACQVDGTVVVKPHPHQPPTAKFCLVIRDLLDRIEGIDLRANACSVVAAEDRSDLHKSDTVLHVNPPTQEQLEQEIPVASYTCTSKLRPVPMLIKSRVQTANRFRRVGFKIRANPHNTAPLQQIVIMLAVPPCVDGPSVKMTRQGGVWDEMKRTISWIVDILEPGKALEVQAQFEGIEGSSQEAQFPVMVRAEYATLFSGVEVTTADVAAAIPITMKLHESARVLHRKI